MTDATTEAVTEEVTQTPAEQEAAAEAAFSKGYNETKGIEPEEKKADEVKEEGEKTPDSQTPEVKTDTPANEARVFGMTEAEFKAALTQSGAKVDTEVRKVFSKIGEINRTVQELNKKLSAGPSGRKFTAADLKRVNDELPGLGEALAQDLSALLGGADAAQAAAESKGQTFDPEAYHAEKLAPALQKMEARIAQVSEEAQTELLAYIHPDYEAYLKTDTFSNWLKSLPEDRRKAVVESPRAVVAAQAITDAKAWQAKAEKAKKQSQTRLEGAITPKGAGAQPANQQPDEDAGFRRGYKKAAGR